MQLSFDVRSVFDPGRPNPLTVRVDRLVIAGWTARDPAAVQHHIAELAALGVSPPSVVPLFYRVAHNQLSQDEVVEVVGEATSGEAEPFLFFHDDEVYVSLASDHTDRALEAQSVALSKQICVKPVARTAWRFAEVEAHWDTLQLRSWVDEGQGWVLYQEGPLAALRAPADLLARFSDAGTPPSNGFAMSCGTVAVRGAIRPAFGFRMQLLDARRDRQITHEYRCRVLQAVA